MGWCSQISSKYLLFCSYVHTWDEAANSHPDFSKQPLAYFLLFSCLFSTSFPFGLNLVTKAKSANCGIIKPWERRKRNCETLVGNQAAFSYLSPIPSNQSSIDFSFIDEIASWQLAQIPSALLSRYLCRVGSPVQKLECMYACICF